MFELLSDQLLACFPGGSFSSRRGSLICKHIVVDVGGCVIYGSIINFGNEGINLSSNGLTDLLTD